MENREAALAAFDKVKASGGNNAEALGAAAAVEGRDILVVFNDLLASGDLAFVFIDVRHLKLKEAEGMKLARVVDADGTHVVDGKLVRR